MKRFIPLILCAFFFAVSSAAAGQLSVPPATGQVKPDAENSTPGQIEITIDTPAPAAETGLSPDDLAKILLRTYVLIQDEALHSPDAEKMMQEAAKAMTGLLDKYSMLMEPARAQEFFNPEAQFSGIGAAIAASEDQRFFAQKVFRNSPAQKAGLAAGDELTTVDGEAISGLTLVDVVARIRGKDGTTVVLGVKRDDKEMTIQVTRGIVKTVLVEAKILPSGVGYVHIESFTETRELSTVNELQQALHLMNKSGVSLLILDVRGNPGGRLDSVISAVDMFLEPGLVIAELYGREHVLQSSHVTKHKALANQRLAVLVDKDSASASEIFVGALQIHHRAIVAGEPTFGKGVVQSSYSLPGGYMLKLTVAEYRLAGGVSVPVIPDVNSIDDPKTAADEPFEAAEKLLLSR